MRGRDSENHEPSLTFRELGIGELFVLLHPGGSDSRALNPLVAELADDYTLVLPDQRGHGRTPDTTGPLTFARMAADTAAVIEERTEIPVHL